MKQEVIVSIHLQIPFDVSLGSLQELASVWHLRILSASTSSPFASLSIPMNKFHKMFHKQPKKGKLEVHPLMQSFIRQMTITEIRNET